MSRRVKNATQHDQERADLRSFFASSAESVGAARGAMGEATVRSQGPFARNRCCIDILHGERIMAKRPERERFWRELVARRESSGLAVTELYRQAGVLRASFVV